MMTSRYDRNEYGKLKKSIFIFFLVFYFFNYFLGENIRPYIVNSFSFIIKKITPLDSTFSSWRINFLDKENLLNETIFLQDKNIKLQNELENLKLSVSNSVLTEEFVKSGEADIVKANRITPKASFIYNNILLNKGFKDGVKDGNLVFVSGLLPIGKIKEVFSDSSNLELFSAKNNKLECYVHLNRDSVGENGATSNDTLNIEVYADGAYNFVTEIPDSAALSLGDKVYLREFSNYYIGTIKSIEYKDSEKINIIYIKSNLDPNKNYDFYIKK